MPQTSHLLPSIGRLPSTRNPESRSLPTNDEKPELRADPNHTYRSRMRSLLAHTGEPKTQPEALNTKTFQRFTRTRSESSVDTGHIPESLPDTDLPSTTRKVQHKYQMRRSQNEKSKKDSNEKSARSKPEEKATRFFDTDVSQTLQ
jgi:hypothetical protein